VKSDPTFPKRVASIDIGTNTILLLISEVERREIHPLFEMETVVRLGEGVQKNKMLLDEAMERGIQTLTQYLQRCQAMEVQEIFAAGTSALREAKNSENFLKLVKEKLNLSIEVISEEEEAQLSFLAVAKDLGEINLVRNSSSCDSKPSEAFNPAGLILISNPATEQPGIISNGVKIPILVVDVGGGSTEFILGKGHQIHQWISLPLGSVRFTEQFLHSDPVQYEEMEEMEGKIREQFVHIPHPQEPFFMVAVGGTATTLASVEQGLDEFIPEKIHHYILKKGELKKQLLLYRSKTIEERKKIPGLPVARADVIFAGGTILYLAMEELKCSSVLISCHGVRYGLLYKKLNL